MYKSAARSVSDLKAHLVLTTKYRKKVITPAILTRLTELIQHISQKWGCEVIEFNGEADHVHASYGKQKSLVDLILYRS